MFTVLVNKRNSSIVCCKALSVVTRYLIVKLIGTIKRAAIEVSAYRLTQVSRLCLPYTYLLDCVLVSIPAETHSVHNFSFNPIYCPDAVQTLRPISTAVHCLCFTDITWLLEGISMLPSDWSPSVSPRVSDSTTCAEGWTALSANPQACRLPLPPQNRVTVSVIFL